MSTKTISIIIPAYNEARFIGELLEQIADVDLGSRAIEKEVIVIDDCSADATASVVAAHDWVRLLRHERNQGKGAAVRTGLEAAAGDYIIIQDADLEYDPRDYLPMIDALLAGGVDAVYGSRYLKHPQAGAVKNLIAGKHAGQGWAAYLGGQSLSFVGMVFTGRYLTDTVTALKLFHREVIKPLVLVGSGFELDHEITSKILARGLTIKEVPIRYYPRSREDGKKIGARDWFTAIRTFARHRKG